jgi:hypothetical protein
VGSTYPLPRLRHRTGVHAKASGLDPEAIYEALSSEYGRLYTSDYVYDECVTLTRKRTGQFRYARRVGDCIRGHGEFPDVIELLDVTTDLFDRSVAVFDRYRDHDLSFTDASTIALIEEHGFDAVLAFDDDFDGLVPRLDPTEIAA